MSPAGASPTNAMGRVLALLAPANTLVVASEFIVIGLLPLLAQDSGVTLAQAGQLTGWFAFSAAVFGPLATLAVSRRSPRQVLVAALLLFAAGNAAIALASQFWLLLAVRVIQGAALPAFISAGAAVVSRMAEPEQRGRALANANLGFVIGVLVALPAGVALAQGGDWRLPFLALALLPLPVAVLVRVYFPADVRPETVRLRDQVGLLRSPVFLAHLLLSALVFAAMFAAYTYLSAWLDKSLGLSVGMISIVLFGFSAAGLAGNWVASRVADKAPLGATVATTLLLAIAVSLAALAHTLISVMIVLLAIWSIAHTAGVTLATVRVTMAGGQAAAFALSMNISAANLGISLGAYSGGVAIDAWGLDAIGVTTAVFAVLAAVLAGLIGMRQRTAVPA